VNRFTGVTQIRHFVMAITVARGDRRCCHARAFVSVPRTREAAPFA